MQRSRNDDVNDDIEGKHLDSRTNWLQGSSQRGSLSLFNVYGLGLTPINTSISIFPSQVATSTKRAHRRTQARIVIVDTSRHHLHTRRSWPSWPESWLTRMRGTPLLSPRSSCCLEWNKTQMMMIYTISSCLCLCLKWRLTFTAVPSLHRTTPRMAKGSLTLPLIRFLNKFELK